MQIYPACKEITYISRNLSDVDKDGKLNCDEFCIAMHLTDLVRMGTVLPAKLPQELMPTKGRAGSFGTTPPPTAPGMYSYAFNRPSENGYCITC